MGQTPAQDLVCETLFQNLHDGGGCALIGLANQ